MGYSDKSIATESFTTNVVVVSNVGFLLQCYVLGIISKYDDTFLQCTLYIFVENDNSMCCIG